MRDISEAIEEKSFWEKLKGFAGQQPGVQAGVPPGLQQTYRQAEPVWNPFYPHAPEEVVGTSEEREKAAAMFDIPEAVVSNIAYRMTQPMHTLGKPDLPGWKMIKESVSDAVHGNRYGSFLDVFKMSMLSPGEAAAWGDFVDKYRIGKAADTVAEIGLEMAAGAILEAGIGYGISGAARGVSRSASGIRGIIKGMFDDVSVRHFMSGSIDDAIDEALTKKQIYTEVLEQLKSKKFEGVEGVATWADVANDVMEYAAEEGMVVRGIWPAQPTIKQVEDIADHFGIKLKMLPKEGGGWYNPLTKRMAIGERHLRYGEVLEHADDFYSRRCCSP